MVRINLSEKLAQAQAEDIIRWGGTATRHQGGVSGKLQHDAGAMITSGVDLWLNTPEPPLEASGTSGIKAALNGVLNLSVLDSW